MTLTDKQIYYMSDINRQGKEKTVKLNMHVKLICETFCVNCSYFSVKGGPMFIQCSSVHIY